MTRKREHYKNKMGSKTQLAVNALTLIAFFFCLAITADAAECRSVHGQVNGVSVSAGRKVKLTKSKIFLSGTFQGRPAPRRSLPCMLLAKGVLCETAFNGVIVSVMTNGNRMVEFITNQDTRQELANIAYVCDRVMKP